MKKFIIVILLMYIPGLVLAGSGKPEWYWVRPKPTGNDLTSVKFINSMTGYACGNNGDVIKTTNGGVNWILLNTPASRKRLNSIYATTSGNVVAVGDSGIMIQSNDFGKTWNIVSTISQNITLRGVKFVDNNIGYACGFSGVFVYQSHIFKTIDGGSTWNQLSGSPAAGIVALDFYSENYGIITGQNSAFITYNGGQTWVQQTMDFGFLTIGKCVKFVDSLNIGISFHGEQMFISTTNGGQNWNRYNISVPNIGSSVDIYEAHTFVNNTTGYMVSRFGRVLKTTNGGVNWSFQNTHTNLWYIESLSENYITACGYGGTILRSTDLGNNWNTVMGGYQPLNHLVFVNQSTGFACGNRGTIIKTTDQGETWSDLNSGVTVKLNQLYFINESTGYCVGDTGTFLKTTNAGDTWIVQNSGTNLEIYSVHFFNELSGIIAPMGNIQVTTNGGTSWQSQFFFTFARFRNFHFTNETTGIAANGYVYRTTNGGFNWNLIYDEDDYSSNLFFIDNETAYYLKQTKILKTFDSGLNWSVWQTSFGANPRNIFFGSRYIGLASYGSGFSGGMNKTTDGGNTWFDYPTVSGSANTWITFINANTGIAVDWRGCIIKTTNEIITDIASTSNEVPEKIQLFQNYPNPFNSETSIRYELPVSTNVRLVIHDMLGREIVTLINEKQTVGIHSVKWSAAGLPSGIYFYTLYSDNNFVQTKKLTLLK